MNWLRDNIISRENVATFRGRPLMYIWNVPSWDAPYTHDRIMDRWGSYANFVDDLRSMLRDGDTDPFIVAGTGWYGYVGYPSDRKKSLSRQFDATSTWVAGGAWKQNEPNNFATQESALDYAEQNFKGNLQFVNENDMEFVPMTFPGFNERGCPERKSDERKTPRSPEFFWKTLELADEYRTTDLVDIAPYNNWLEGTQIAPGSFMGEDYGTEYLEAVKGFQTPKSQ